LLVKGNKKPAHSLPFLCGKSSVITPNYAKMMQIKKMNNPIAFSGVSILVWSNHSPQAAGNPTIRD